MSDDRARAFAVDPRNNVVLEASAGTGKTSVLVSRYINLVKTGVEPANILAITFTRKAAAEMRERIVAQLREAGERSEIDKARWHELRDRLGEIAISTIDAFCLSLLREFPLEADLDPGFEMADETEVPRIMEEAIDRSLRILVGRAREDADIALVLAQLGIARTREGLATLLDRRLVARDALHRFLARGPSDLTPEVVCTRAAEALYEVLQGIPGGLAQFVADGPAGHGRYSLFTREVARLVDWHHVRKGAWHLFDEGARHLRPSAEGARHLSGESARHLSGESARHLGEAEVRGLLDRIGSHFLTNEGEARRTGRIHPYVAADYPTKDAERRHRDALFQAAPGVERVMAAFHRDLNVILARGVRRMFEVALQQYRSALEERSVLDFSDVLQRAVDLLRNMGEFSQSRYRLESRYHHVLVDEFQDTSRAQWELISLLIRAWGEGIGLASQPSIFIVGDRKQSIYRFRDAEVAVLREAAGYIEGLRPGRGTRRSIARSFRALPVLQAFVNDVFTAMSQGEPPGGEGSPARPDDFTFEDADRFPVDATLPLEGPVLGVAVADSPDACASAIADEIRRILDQERVRDRATGVARRAKAGDIAVLFRSRTSHREFERELIARGIPTYVYKGLGFFDADEIKDLFALLRYLSVPESDLRAAALLRSRFIRLSDRGLAALAPRLSAALTQPFSPAVRAALDTLDAPDRRAIERARACVPSWLARVDRVPPSDLLEQILNETAYVYEIRGPRRHQAWENIKKMRGLVRRLQNRGYATMTRLAEHLDSLVAGDESNAVLEAVDAVNLMTVHAAKGLEFPVVFIVNLAKGATGPPRPVRVIVDGDTDSVSVGRFASELDEVEREREKHETRRLLYVALTRARDRLYLSTSLKEGKLVPGRGSLAEVLPPAILELLERAAAAVPSEASPKLVPAPKKVPGTFSEKVPATFLEGALFGDASSGGILSAWGYDWLVCPPSTPRPEPDPDALATPTLGGDTRRRPDLFGQTPAATGPRRTSVSDWLQTDDPPRDLGAPPSSAIAGTLVHRLFQFAPRAAAPDEPQAALDHRQEDDEARWLSIARDLLRADERASVPDVDGLVRAAVQSWRRMREQPDLARVLADGELVTEVPFALAERQHGSVTILRGTIDCLVRRSDGSMVVVEFKTGRPGPSHEPQLDVYVRAARACFPGASVEPLLVYL